MPHPTNGTHPGQEQTLDEFLARRRTTDQNPPEIAFWESGEWCLAGDGQPWQPEAASVASERHVFKPRMTAAA